MLMGMMIIVGFIVGFLVGCTGMGGIILIPALVYLSGLSSHVAMGTTLFTFIFTTSLCSWLYIRLGHVDWKATIPICIGGFLFTYVGADVKAFTAAPYLNLILALLILLAGDILLAVRNGLGPAAVVASLAAVLLMDLLFELSLRQFSRVDAVGTE